MVATTMIPTGIADSGTKADVLRNLDATRAWVVQENEENLMAARAYLDAGGGPNEDAIRESIAGNLCRCTGYTKIVDAIALVASGGAL